MQKYLLILFCIVLCCSFSGVDERPLLDFMTCKINGKLSTTQFCRLIYSDLPAGYTIEGQFHYSSDTAFTVELYIDSLAPGIYPIAYGMASVIMLTNKYHFATKDSSKFITMSIDTINDTIVRKGNFSFTTDQQPSVLKITDGFFYFRQPQRRPF